MQPKALYQKIRFTWFDKNNKHAIKCLSKIFIDVNPMCKQHTTLYELLSHPLLQDNIYNFTEKEVKYTIVDLYLDRKSHCSIYSRLQLEYPEDLILGDELENWLIEIAE